MNRRERLEDVHLALEGAVDQLTRAHRAALDAGGFGELEAIFQQVVELRNRARDELLKELAKPAPPLIRPKKD